MCDKVAYDTHGDAIDAATGFAKRKKVALRTYRCDQCGFWHLASSKSKKKMYRKQHKYKWNWRT